MPYRIAFILAIVTTALSALASETERGTVIREAQLYVSLDPASQKVGIPILQRLYGDARLSDSREPAVCGSGSRARSTGRISSMIQALLVVDVQNEFSVLTFI